MVPRTLNLLHPLRRRAALSLAAGLLALVLGQAVLLVHSVLDNHAHGEPCELCLGGHTAGAALATAPLPPLAAPSAPPVPSARPRPLRTVALRGPLQPRAPPRFS